jgi:hypothetical protein
MIKNTAGVSTIKTSVIEDLGCASPSFTFHHPFFKINGKTIFKHDN